MGALISCPGSPGNSVVELLLPQQNAHPDSAEDEGQTPYGMLPRGSRECDEDTCKLPGC